MQQASATLSPLDLLIIEDEKSLCENLELFFSMYHLKVLFLKSIKEVTQWIHTNSNLPPLTFVDRRLSDDTMDGLLLIQTLRARDKNNAAIYLFSAETTTLEQAKLYGATGIFPKPFDLSELLRLIKTHINRYSFAEKSSASGYDLLKISCSELNH